VWDAWFQEYYPNLFRYAWIRLHNRGEAEDIASQVFVEALRGIRSFVYTGRPILAWLYRIEHNLVVDRLKAEERRSRLTPSPAEGAALEGPEGLVGNIDLLNAIKNLTEEQRQVVILRYFMAMSAEEVARVIDKTQAAVYSLQARALATLRRSLAAEDEGVA
jgi:RNA polymerase sigma-70 factor (ECF subfamily)